MIVGHEEPVARAFGVDDDQRAGIHIVEMDTLRASWLEREITEVAERSGKKGQRELSMNGVCVLVLKSHDYSLIVQPACQTQRAQKPQKQA